MHRWESMQVRSWSESSWESERSASTEEYGYGSSDMQESHEVSDVRYAYWTDAYGRRHCYDKRLGREVGWRRAEDESARRDPWHGYDDNDGPENGY